MNIAIITLKALDAALMLGEFQARDKANLEASASAIRAMLREERMPNAEEWADANRLADDALGRLAERAAQG